MKVLYLQESHCPGAVLEIKKGVFLVFSFFWWGGGGVGEVEATSYPALWEGSVLFSLTCTGLRSPRAGLHHLGQDAATMHNATPPLQASEEAPLSSKPRTGGSCTLKSFLGRIC